MKIIVSDFDKTFFTENYLENIKAIKDFISKGNIFIIATGRPLYLLKPDIEKYEIKYKYLICNDGAVIFDNKDNIIYKENMTCEDSKNIYKELIKSKNNLEVYIDNIYKTGNNFDDNCNGIIAKPIDKDIAKQQITEICLKYKNIQGYLSHKWINILNSKASKGIAIKKICELNNWNTCDIITIGDNKNDISMMNDFKSYAIDDEDLNLIPTQKKVKNFIEMLNEINKSN